MVNARNRRAIVLVMGEPRYPLDVTNTRSSLPSPVAKAPGIPPAEVAVDDELVRELLRTQHPDLADLPIRLASTGWDNYMFRLGDSLAVRLPRITGGAELILKEQHWLPLLAPRLPVVVPVPVRLGQAGSGYPWAWSVVSWVPGRSGEHESLNVDEAGRFGRFLAAAHCPATPDAPRNDYRGMPLASKTDDVESRLHGLASRPGESHLDWQRLWQIWRAATVAPLDIAETLIHGDLHPKNLVVENGRLMSVIDWGDMTVGDPATDLAAAWMLFPPEAHSEIWGAYGQVSAATMARALGWAVFFGTMILETGLANDPPFIEIGRRTLQRLT